MARDGGTVALDASLLVLQPDENAYPLCIAPGRHVLNPASSLVDTSADETRMSAIQLDAEAIAWKKLGSGGFRCSVTIQPVRSPSFDAPPILLRGPETDLSAARQPPPQANPAPGVGFVIPTLEFDERLLQLINELRARGLENIIVVDDGSSSFSGDRHCALEDRCTVLAHAIPLGKGRALKTGLNHGLVLQPELQGLVTVDPNGRHTPDDVVAVARALAESSDRLVMGSRRRDRRMPRLSRVANAITRLVILLLTGLHIADAQCGLRGIPRGLIPQLLKLKGEGLDYEINALITAVRWRNSVLEVPIRAVGPDPTARGFNPALDSFAIYFLLVRFGFSSLTCAVVDTGVYYLLLRAGSGLGIAVFSARAVSSLLNFALNRGFVFHSHRRVIVTAAMYYTLVAVVGVLSYLSIRFLHEGLGMGLLSSKILSETVLFGLSFLIQRDVIFRRVEWNAR